MMVVQDKMEVILSTITFFSIEGIEGLCSFASALERVS